jgi:hypothetical protein
MNYLKRASDKEVSPESLGVGYGSVGVILEVSPCQCRQYNNAEATWAYAGCRLVALRQLEAAEKANGCAEHGHFIQPGPAPKGGYSPRPAVAPNFATTGPDAHTPAHAAELCATYMSSNASCTSWVAGFSLRSIMPQVLDAPLRFAHLCAGIQQPPGRWECQRAALPEGRADGRRRRTASTIRGAPYMHATARASWWWCAGVWRCSPTASISALPALLPLTGRW